MADGSCQQVQVCGRCGFEGRRVVHKYGKWEYVTEQSCKQVYECSRCGQKQEQVEHDWWTVPHYDLVAEVCGRCGTFRD
jgi:hypothetical protein